MKTKMIYLENKDLCPAFRFMITGLLAYLIIRNGMVTPRIRPPDFHTVRSYQQHSKAFHSLPEADYCGNEELLSQVWANLLSNAFKFTSKGGTISICILKKPGFTGVEVHDSGIGMTPEVPTHIFDKFYQGERGRNIEGNGLGLALVKKIVTLCGGTVDIESQPDCGSVFRMWLP